MIGLVGAVALLVAGGIATVLMLPKSGDRASEGTDTSSAPQTTPTRDAAAESRLMSMLPQGYSASACKAVEPTNGVLAQVDCGPTDDPAGPTSATYALVQDKAALTAAFDRTTKNSSIVVCPGRIQSPGPWRRNANPDTVAGTVYCGLIDGHPTVGWTDEARLLLSQTHAGDGGPTFDQLYTWWSMHS